MSAGLDVEAGVRHRLALGVEVIDAVTESAVPTVLSIERERHDRPDTTLIGGRGGRFRLLHGLSVRDEVTLRIFDQERRYVPRRFRVPLWTEAEVRQNEDDPTKAFVPAGSRTLRPWLAPDVGCPCSGATGLRAQLLLDREPLRWARITAATDGGTVLGRTHGNDRGEFLLLLSGRGVPRPARDEVTVNLTIRARLPQPDPDPDDRLADCPVEVQLRPSNPPVPTDLDNPRLRGEVPPPGFSTSSFRPRIPLRFGTVTALGPFQFIP